MLLTICVLGTCNLMNMNLEHEKYKKFSVISIMPDRHPGATEECVNFNSEAGSQ